MSPLGKNKARRDSSLTLMICPYTMTKTMFFVFLCIVLLAVRMVADVTKIRNIIPSLEFKS